MSEHEFTIRVKVDDAALEEYNRRAEASRIGLLVGDDPSDWDDGDLAIARNEELAEVEVIDYRAIVDAATAYAIDKESRDKVAPETELERAAARG